MQLAIYAELTTIKSALGYIYASSHLGVLTIVKNDSKKAFNLVIRKYKHQVVEHPYRD